MTDYSLSDIAAVSGANKDNGLFGGENGSWFIIILFLFAFLGWGGNGNNNGGGGMMPYYMTGNVDSAVQRGFDNSAVINKLNGLENGLCDGFYTTATQMLTGFDRITNNTNQGFAGLNTVITNGNYENRAAIANLGYQNQQCCCDIERAIDANTVAGMRNLNDVTAQLTNMAFQNKDCCCGLERQIEKGFSDVTYRMASDQCQTMQAIDKLGDRLVDFWTNDKIQTLRDENQALKFEKSQNAQTAFLANVYNNSGCGC